MRRYITIFVLLIINFLLQTTVFRYIEIAHMVPNLILVVTVAAGLLYGRKCGIFAGVISGLLTIRQCDRYRNIDLFCCWIFVWCCQQIVL